MEILKHLPTQAEIDFGSILAASTSQYDVTEYDFRNRSTRNDMLYIFKSKEVDRSVSVYFKFKDDKCTGLSLKRFEGFIATEDHYLDEEFDLRVLVEWLGIHVRLDTPPHVGSYGYEAWTYERLFTPDDTKVDVGLDCTQVVRDRKFTETLGVTLNEADELRKQYLNRDHLQLEMDLPETKPVSDESLAMLSGPVDEITNECLAEVLDMSEDDIEFMRMDFSKVTPESQAERLMDRKNELRLIRRLIPSEVVVAVEWILDHEDDEYWDNRYILTNWDALKTEFTEQYKPIQRYVYSDAKNYVRYLKLVISILQDEVRV